MLEYMPGLAYHIKKIQIRKRREYLCLDRELQMECAAREHYTCCTHLGSALDNIKGANCGVCKTAGEDATDHALGIVAHIMDVTHCVFMLVKIKWCFDLSIFLDINSTIKPP